MSLVATWNCPDLHARAQCGDLRAALDLTRLTDGLTELCLPGHQQVKGSALALCVPNRPSPDPPVDHYVRGSDLIAHYGARSTDMISHRVQYRLVALENGCGFELSLSAQTSRLHSIPRMQVATELPAGELVWVNAEMRATEVTEPFWQQSAPGLFLFRPAKTTHSSVFFVHATDFFQAHAETNGTLRAVLEVFPESLEKGVIRTAVFSFFAIPRHHDLDCACKLFQDACAAPPPLTT